MPEANAALGEQRMMPLLLELLRRTRRLRPDSVVAAELPWHGRRVDLATLSKSDVLSAYELKLGGFSRVMEQALYNQLSFDRSWIVVEALPTAANLEVARHHGIGVIIATSPYARTVLAARSGRSDSVLRRRLAMKIHALGTRDV